jgi:pyruvate/2-oxoglutarate dehydrogenase complex dihydrolipoamide acyltransferase (E2) component
MRTAVALVQFPQDEEIAVVARWHVEDGSIVHLGDLLADVEVGKATIEVTALAAGVIEIVRRQGVEFLVGKELAFIESD